MQKDQIHEHAWQCQKCGQVSDHALTTPRCEHNIGLKRVSLPKPPRDEVRIRRCIP